MNETQEATKQTEGATTQAVAKDTRPTMPLVLCPTCGHALTMRCPCCSGRAGGKAAHRMKPGRKASGLEKAVMDVIVGDEGQAKA